MKKVCLRGLKFGLAIFLMFLFSQAASGGEKEAKTGTIKGKVTYKKKGDVRETVVYVEKMEGGFEPVKVNINQKNSTFIPRFVFVTKGSTVTFKNSDPTIHSVYSPDGEGYDLGQWDKGESKSYIFKETGVYRQLCKLHASMLAYVFVLQNPFAAVSDDEGIFEIKDVPPGKYTLVAWNKRRTADPVTVEVKAGKASEVEMALKTKGRDKAE